MFAKAFTNFVAPDDLVWVKAVPLLGLGVFLKNPVEWVATNIPNCTLANNFDIKVRASQIRVPTNGSVLIQGICGTSQVSLTLPPNGLVLYLSELSNATKKDLRNAGFGSLESDPADAVSSILMRLATPRKLETTVVVGRDNETSGKAFSHFELNDVPFVSAEERGLFIAAYILDLIDHPERLFGHFRDGQQVGTRFLFEDGMAVVSQPTDPIVFEPFTSPGDISFTYSGEVNSTVDACEMLLGLYRDGKVTAEEVFIKAYE